MSAKHVSKEIAAALRDARRVPVRECVKHGRRSMWQGVACVACLDANQTSRPFRRLAARWFRRQAALAL